MRANPRAGISAYYFATGVLTALWGSTLPAQDARLHLGAGRMGLLLLVLGLGGLAAMPVAGAVSDRWTSRRLLRVVAPLAGLALAGPAMAPDFTALVCSAALLGAGMGLLNVALTAQAVAVEACLARPVMSSLHGTWTLGAVAGGALTTAGLHAGLGVRSLLTASALVLCVLYALPAGLLVHGRRPKPEATTAPGPGRRLLVTLGLLGAAAFLTEGAATDWSGIHARQVLGASPATASLVYTLFFGSMTLVRLGGDALRARFSPAAVIRIAGVGTSAGFGLVLLSPAAGIGCAMAGWALTGMGIATVWPVVASSVGQAGDGTARGISVITTVGYSGSLLGPALIGCVAALTDLPVALTIPAALAVGIAVAGPRALAALARQARPATAPAGDHVALERSDMGRLRPPDHAAR